MKVIRIENSLFLENTYIVFENNTALVIDPGSDLARIEQVITDNNLSDIKIYLTHSHYDHIHSVNALKNKYNALIYVHEAEKELLANSKLNLSSNFDEPIEISDVVSISDHIKLFNDTLNVYHVPGHTKGHSMLEIKKINSLFTGDFIFKNDIGRCDLPTGNLDVMYKSLEFLKTMNPNLIIYPGHGDCSTIKDELKNNTYLK